MTPVHYMNMTELATLLVGREISAVEVTRAELSRIAELDSDLAAYATVMTESAILDAERADQAIARGNYLGPLHGVPLALKDLCYTRGVPTQGGTSALSDFVPNFDATVVTKLRAAGAIILGKLNLAEGAMAAYNPKFAAPYNPWDAALAPGGSSSGSGVATAAGLCFGSLGTDTGGSIRFPASMCGVVGVKPTWGRVSRHGILDLAPSMDHVGTLTRCVTDAAFMLEAIAGHDENDPTSISADLPDLGAAIESGVSGLRIGYAEGYSCLDVDGETSAAVKTALRSLAAEGASIVDVEMPILDDYIIAWRDLCASEALAAHGANYPEHAAEYGPWFRSWLAHGAGCSGADYARAHAKRLACNADLARVFSNIDVLLCPAMAGPEQRKNDSENFREPMGTFKTQRQRFTIPYNFNGAPTITVPYGFHSGGAPLSVQCVANPMCEAAAFQAAAAIERRRTDAARVPIP